MRAVATAITCVLLLAAGGGTPVPAGASGRDTRALVEAAQQAMNAQRFDEALDLYGRAGELMPDAAEIPFNMGVAAYRAGDLERALELFDRARTLSADPSMQAQSAYNLGTTSARQALQSKMDDPAVAQAQMAEATASLRTALDRFRDAIAMNPDDQDARANGELAWRWLKQLEQLQEQMQQQGDQQQQRDDQEQDDQDQQQPDEQQQQQQQQQGDQQQQDQQQQQGEQQDQQPQQGQEEQQQEQQPQGGDEQQEQEEQEEAQPTTGEEEIDERDRQQQTSDVKPMSREEAERLLQRVRDKEAQRRRELARQEAGRQRPVDKDW